MKHFFFKTLTIILQKNEIWTVDITFFHTLQTKIDLKYVIFTINHSVILATNLIRNRVKSCENIISVSANNLNVLMCGNNWTYLISASFINKNPAYYTTTDSIFKLESHRKILIKNITLIFVKITADNFFFLSS